MVIYGDLWRFLVIYKMFHDVFKKSSEHDWTSETSDYINTQKNDRQSKIPNLFFLVPDIFTGSYGDCWDSHRISPEAWEATGRAQRLRATLACL
jgi:hypothetical protein